MRIQSTGHKRETWSEVGEGGENERGDRGKTKAQGENETEIGGGQRGASAAPL